MSNSDTNLCSVRKYHDSINKYKMGTRNTEALCFRWVMKVSVEMVFHNGLFKTNSQRIFFEWKKKGSYRQRNYFGGVVEDFRSVFMQIPVVGLIFTRRASNVLADSLVRLAFIYHTMYWLEELLVSRLIQLTFV